MRKLLHYLDGWYISDGLVLPYLLYIYSEKLHVVILKLRNIMAVHSCHYKSNEMVHVCTQESI